jgi:hypothetical protein
MIDLPPPSYEQTIEAVYQCGVPRSNIRIAYEDYLQSDEVTISDVGAVSDAKLRCVRKAVHPFYILTLANLEHRSAFYELERKDDRPVHRQQAREWARSKGWTARIPKFNESVGIQAFARALEVACELRVRSAIVAIRSRSLTVRPEFFTNSNFEDSGKALECLTRMFAASNADEHGVRFVFIGNEASVEEKN